MQKPAFRALFFGLGYGSEPSPLAQKFLECRTNLTRATVTKYRRPRDQVESWRECDSALGDRGCFPVQAIDPGSGEVVASALTGTEENAFLADRAYDGYPVYRVVADGAWSGSPRPGAVRSKDRGHDRGQGSGSKDILGCQPRGYPHEHRRKWWKPTTTGFVRHKNQRYMSSLAAEHRIWSISVMLTYGMRRQDFHGEGV